MKQRSTKVALLVTATSLFLSTSVQAQVIWEADFEDAVLSEAIGTNNSFTNTEFQVRNGATGIIVDDSTDATSAAGFTKGQGKYARLSVNGSPWSAITGKLDPAVSLFFTAVPDTHYVRFRADIYIPVDIPQTAARFFSGLQVTPTGNGATGSELTTIDYMTAGEYTIALNDTVGNWRADAPGTDVDSSRPVIRISQNEGGFDINGSYADFLYMDNLVYEISATPFPDASLVRVGAGLDFGNITPAGAQQTITFRNDGISEDLTIDSIALNNDAAGVYSIFSAPAASTVIAPNETFDVIIATSGGSGVTAGELAINVTHAGTAVDADTTEAITANIDSALTTLTAAATSGSPKYIAGQTKELLNLTAEGNGTTINITNITFDNPDLTWAGTPFSIDNGSTANVEVTLDGGSNASGIVTSQATIVYDDPDNANDSRNPDETVAVTINVFANKTVQLIDYNDGIANGIHDASIRNGGFEEGTAGDDFVATPSWTSKGQSNSTEQLTFNTMPSTTIGSALHGRSGDWLQAGNNFIVTQEFSADDWTLEAGDRFYIEFKVLPLDPSGSTFDLSEIPINVAMFGLNEDKSTVSSIELRPIQVETWIDQKTDYTTVSFFTNGIPEGSAITGRGFQILFEVNRPFTNITPHLAYFDDVSVRASFTDGNPESVPAFQVSEFEVDAYHRSNTNTETTDNTFIEWNDIGGTFTIEASDTLDFTSPVATAVEDVHSRNSNRRVQRVNGVIKYYLQDTDATGLKRFYRVTQD